MKVAVVAMNIDNSSIAIADCFTFLLLNFNVTSNRVTPILHLPLVDQKSQKKFPDKNLTTSHKNKRLFPPPPPPANFYK